MRQARRKPSPRVPFDFAIFFAMLDDARRRIHERIDAIGKSAK